MDAMLNDLFVLFRSGKHQRFESGYSSDFSRAFLSYLEEYSYTQRIFNLIWASVVYGNGSDDVYGEVCRWLGHCDHRASRDKRRQCLERILLDSKSVFVRDAAGLGIASIDDPASIPAVTTAVEKEKNEELKADLQQVLDQLMGWNNLKLLPNPKYEV